MSADLWACFFINFHLARIGFAQADDAHFIAAPCLAGSKRIQRHKAHGQRRFCVDQHRPLAFARYQR